MPSHRKAAQKLVREATKKASRFAKNLGESMGCSKVANHAGTDNSYKRPETPYDQPMHSRVKGGY